MRVSASKIPLGGHFVGPAVYVRNHFGSEFSAEAARNPLTLLFSPLTFADGKQAYWFPTEARVEVETARQHWRNLHQFTAYKKFSVSTEEKVAQK